MDVIKIRLLMKSIEAEYGVSDCFLAAEMLCQAGIFELDDDIRAKISYLKNICIDFSFENYYLGMLVSDLSYNDLSERYNRYVAHTGEEGCRMGSLRFSDEQIRQYADYFQQIGFDSEQEKNIIREIFKLGEIAKGIDETKAAVEALECMGLSTYARNQFICENADILFNHYARDIDRNLSMVIDKFGAVEGFEYIKKNPMVMRFGIEE